MNIKRLVPTLAVLALAGSAAAMDGVAPVTSLATDDTLLLPVTPTPPNSTPGSVPDVDALDLSSPGAALDLSVLGSRTFAFSSTNPTLGWNPLTTVTGPYYGPTSSGLAIIAMDDGGGLGVWEADTGSGYVALPGVSDTSALLLALANGGGPNAIRFRPYAYAGDGVATLTFRIWDGSDDNSSGSTVDTTNGDPFAPQQYGGSPTPFSAETRTISVHVNAANDAPAINGSPASPVVITDIPVSVSDLLAGSPFLDPDGNTIQAIAITETDTVASSWQYSTDDGGTWSSLSAAQPAVSSGNALLLGSTTLLRWTDTATNGTGLLTVHAWDETSGSSGSIIAVDSSVSGTALGVTVQANVAPAIDSISGPDGTNTLHVRRGTTATVTAYGSDADAGDVLSWSAASTSYSGTHGTVNTLSATGSQSDITYDAGADDTDTVQVTLTDLAGNSVNQTFNIVVTDNQLPTVDRQDTVVLSVHVGEPDLQFNLVSGDADNDTLAWSASTNAYGLGSVSLQYSGGNRTSAAAGNVASYHPLAVGTDTITIAVDDGFGGTASVQVTIDVLPALNQAPSFVRVTAGDFAIVGQPYEVIVRATDPDTADIANLSLAVTSYSSGNLHATATTLGAGLWRVRWTPAAPNYDSVQLVVADRPAADPQRLSDSYYIYPQYVAAPPAETIAVSIPTSSAGNIIYGGIAPGSMSGFDQVNSFLTAQGPAIARAFWWSGSAYAELPGSPSDALRNGVFLASTVPANLTFHAAVQPAPFAVNLPAGKWTFFGIPPLMTDSYYPTIETTHPWDMFELQQADGTTVGDMTGYYNLDQVGLIIGPSNADTVPVTDPVDTEPFEYRWNGSSASYQRSGVLNTGTGYWIRNQSGANYRLVRMTSGGGGAPLRHAPAARAAAHAPRASDLPPAPPSSSAAKAEPGGGSCGAGGIAGLLIAGLALIGLRPRRRN